MMKTLLLTLIAGCAVCAAPGVSEVSLKDYSRDPAFMKRFASAAVGMAQRKVKEESAFRATLDCRLPIKPRLSSGLPNIFIWDAAFCCLWAKDAPSDSDLPIAGTLDNFYLLQRPDGFICREYTPDGHPVWSEEHPIAYNPPILAWAEIELFKAGVTDRARLETVYPKLARFHACYQRHLRRPDGLYAGDILGGGMDDIPRWPVDTPRGRLPEGGMAFKRQHITAPDGEGLWNWMKTILPEHGWNFQAGWIDMSAQMAFDALNLAEIAGLLGRTDEARTYRAEHAAIAAAVNANCWDDDAGFYFDRGEKGLIRRWQVGSYWTLLARIPTAERARRLVARLDDPGTFGRPIPVPSLAANDPDYRPETAYWCGAVWPPTTYMTILGLRAYGFEAEAERLARRWYNANAALFESTETIFENISPEQCERPKGMAGRDFCGWSALAPVSIPVLFGWTSAARACHLTSPDGTLDFAISADGDLGYSLSRDGRSLIAKSDLGFKFATEKNPMRGAFEFVSEPVLEKGLVEAWTPVVKSRHASVRLVYNRLTVKLREKGGDRRRMDLTVQAYDDGVAFRYTLFGGLEAGERQIEEELTAYRVPETAKAFVGQNFGGFLVGSQECVCELLPVTKIPSDGWTLTPLVLQVGEKDWIALASACLVDYPGYDVTWRDGAIRTRLVPTVKEAGPGGVRARFTERFQTPWRVILASDHPGRFMENEIIRALNPPCAIEDTSWIKPGKAAWDHWWSGDQRMEMSVLKEYIDLAGSQHWPYIIVDSEWYGPFGKPESDVTKPAPQIDMPALIAYAAERGVRLVLWVDSHDLTRNDQFREAFPLYRDWGIAGVKVDFMDRYDREIVNWYRTITACAAENHLLVDFHGAFVPDGMDRTWPNQITREGVLGAEFNKFAEYGEILTADHHVNLAYTRLLCGPMDYTPGGFLNVAPGKHVFQTPTLMPNTRVQELAKFVVYESPFMVVCEHPTNLVGQAGFEFVSSCPVEWDDTRFVGGEPNEWIAVARRNGSDWYIGVIGGVAPREVTLDLGFLGGREMRFWADGALPREVVRGTKTLPADGKIVLKLAPAGGFAAIVL